MFNQIIQDLKDKKIEKDSIPFWIIKAFHSKKEELDKKCSFISTYVLAIDKFDKEIRDSTDSYIANNIMDFLFDKKRYKKFQSKREISDDIESRILRINSYIENRINNFEWFFNIKIKGRKKVCVFNLTDRVRDLIKKNKDTKFLLIEVPKDIKIDKNVEIYDYNEKSKALINSDIALIDSLSITNNSDFVCEKGAEDFLIISSFMNVPSYCISDFLEISKSCSKKINYKNDLIEFSLINYVISPKGIMKPEDFILESKDFSFLE
ncbi:MAG: hypothetical protein ACQER9_03710 [Nanobdellota archaeon]